MAGAFLHSVFTTNLSTSPIYLFVCLSICLSVCLSIYLYLFFCLLIYLFFLLFIYLFIYLFIHLFIYLLRELRCEVVSEPSKLNSSFPPSCYERVLTQQVNAINLEFFRFRKEVIRSESNKWKKKAH